jgi:hypothetical protein
MIKKTQISTHEPTDKTRDRGISFFDGVAFTDHSNCTNAVGHGSFQAGELETGVPELLSNLLVFGFRRKPRLLKKRRTVDIFDHGSLDLQLRIGKWSICLLIRSLHFVALLNRITCSLVEFKAMQMVLQ